jgi:hypothetical protein
VLISSCFIFNPNPNDGFELRCISATHGSDIKNRLHFRISVFYNKKFCITNVLFSNWRDFFILSYFPTTSRSLGVRTSDMYEQILT